MKNRTKKMMFMTLVATIAVATLLMSRGLAAPLTLKSCDGGSALAETVKNTVSSSTCPTGQALYQMINSSLSSNGTVDIASLVKSSEANALLKKANVTLKTTACPKKTTVAATATPSAAPTATVEPTATVAPTATATPAPTSTSSTSGSMTAEEQKMITLVNNERTAAGLPALTFDSGLRAGALVHSKDMSDNNFFSHTSPSKGDFSTRVKASGVKYASAGENIAMYGSVEKAHTALMNSEGHRANIMNTGYTRIGIGIVYNSTRGYYYITQWFAK